LNKQDVQTIAGLYIAIVTVRSETIFLKGGTVKKQSSNI